MLFKPLRHGHSKGILKIGTKGKKLRVWSLPRVLAGRLRGEELGFYKRPNKHLIKNKHLPASTRQLWFSSHFVPASPRRRRPVRSSRKCCSGSGSRPSAAGVSQPAGHRQDPW